MSKKTNAMRFLDQHQIAYTVVNYQFDDHHLSVKTIAEENGIDLASLYKTLVLKGDKTGVLVALVPGHCQLDYKAIAQLSHNKKVTTVPVADLQQITGYVRGACSPFGMKKSFPVYGENEMLERDTILVNAGQKGCLLRLSPFILQDLCSMVMGKIGKVC